MSESSTETSLLVPVRFEDGRALIVAGFGQRFTLDTNSGIPALWQEFAPFLGKVPGQQGTVSYGVCCHPDGQGGFEYIAGVEVDTLQGLPDEFRSVQLAPQRYAVFEHTGHISSMGQTFKAIWQEWLPSSEFDAADAPEFERYDEAFDPLTGTGGLEIWLPLRN
ncbi:GyrI-like domain-containing protein [Pseudomonas sp. dw_358]|uniref:GyrI-like domain-containing protein n=1 Tax=Pseudomonas sp. dw_358 TaxID=2720083 RepID=UPI001BD4BE0E|nr:GyrI-like domain-containing protein [Pseudomonas sp. dw_358]